VNELFNFKSLLFLASTEESVARKGHDVVEFWKTVVPNTLQSSMTTNLIWDLLKPVGKFSLCTYATCEASFLWMK